MAAAGTGKRRELPHVVVPENQSRAGFVRMGSGELQTDCERESAGGSGLCGGSWKAYCAAIGAGGASRRSEWSGRGAGDVSVKSGRIHARSLENSAGRGLEGSAFGGKCIEVSAGGKFGEHRLSDWADEGAFGVHAAGAGSGSGAADVARCRRMKTARAVLVCDIDGFKQINDSFGHVEGDKLLREFTTRLKDVCRGYDYVARMGGDEFVITAPGLTAEAATEKAERLNQAAVESGRHVCGRDVITLSVGTAFCPEDGFDVERLLAEADRRMYSMKQIHHAAAAARETKIAGAAAN